MGASLLRGRAQAKAADKASKAQTESAEAGIAEMRRQFNVANKLLAPYRAEGGHALEQLVTLMGWRGEEGQRAALSAIEESPEFLAKVSAGENAILQNAAATGGLRGGNTQAALATFRPQMLAEQISTQYNRLGGLMNMGQAAASGTAAQGAQFGRDIAGQYAQIGAAKAGGALAKGEAFSQGLAGVTEGLGLLASYMPEPEPGTGLMAKWGF